MIHARMFESFFHKRLLAIFTGSCRFGLLLLKTCGDNLLLSLLEIAEDGSNLVKCSHLLEVVVHVVERITQVGVHDALL